MSLLVFLDMEPFFTWSSVSPLGYRLYTVMIIVVTAFMALIVFHKKLVSGVPAVTEKTTVSLLLLLVSTLSVVLFLYEVFFSGVVTETQQPYNVTMLCVHLGLMFFILQDNFTLASVFKITKKIFAISLIPALFVFLLYQVGIDLPSITLAADSGKDATGQSYELYMGFAVMLRNAGGLLNRLCGMYREPGFVGTVGVFYLLGDKFNLRKWENLVILISCVCTFSLAFFVLLLLGVVLKAVFNMQSKRNFVLSLTAIVLVVAGYFVFMSLPLDPNTMWGELQARLVITEEGLAGDNRFGGSSEYAQSAFDEFSKSDLSVQLFGYGKDTRVIPGTTVNIWQNVHSYKEFVFNFGYIGLILLAAIFVLGVFVKYKGVSKSAKGRIIALLFVFVISIYQRFGVDTFCYFCVLFGGASNLALMPIDDETQKKKYRRVVFKWKDSTW